MNEDTFELDKKKIEQIVQKYVETLNNGNYEKWLNLWVENAIRLPPHAPMRLGKKKIGDSIKSTMNENDLELTILNIVEIKVYGNIASSIVEYSLSMKPKKGGEKIVAEPNGKSLALLQKQSDGSWKLQYECFNSNIES